MLKDSIYWFIGSALIVLLNLMKAHKEKGFFKKLLLDNLKLLIIIQFIMNVHVFSLTIELILLPVITIIVLIRTYSEHKAEYIQLKNVMDGFLTVIGLTFLTFSVIEILEDIKKFASFATLKTFLFPIILSISFIPFAYLITLYMSYEMLYVRLGFFLSNERDLRYAKWRTLRKCHFSLNKLNQLSSNINELYSGSTRNNIKEIIT